MPTLVFVDTNIYLDFYRLRSREAGLSILEKLDANRASIICGDQVAMEFKKHRQGVILESHRVLKAPDWNSLSLPPIISETKSSRALERHKDGIKSQSQKLKKRLENVLTNPGTYDPVYRTLQRLFNFRGPFNLTREKKVRFEIRERAQKRFILGYPPRKAGDTSMGDAVNWEWIVHCASESGAGVVIVTRDSDYGTSVDGKPVLNDWLREEFRERASKKRKVVLADRISEGLKAASIAVTKKEQDAETNIIVRPETGLYRGRWVDEYLTLVKKFQQDAAHMAVREAPIDSKDDA